MNSFNRISTARLIPSSEGRDSTLYSGPDPGRYVSIIEFSASSMCFGLSPQSSFSLSVLEREDKAQNLLAAGYYSVLLISKAEFSGARFDLSLFIVLIE